jgi:hypothetical protein
MTEEPTLTEELEQTIKEAEATINIPKIKKEISNSENFMRDKVMVSVIPIERYSERDIKRTLKADRKRLDREVELVYIDKYDSDNQTTMYNRMKASEERKLTIKGVLYILILLIGGVSALLEIMKALGGV